ncbi:MAG: hypothetical protein KGQ62_04730 [Gammaproteobacteria bacterium]|nr:hypothetical protein [Gammaproteobacteria bacterium]MBU6510038.1 hypothetical protein [Gammaproteobacteria bacterium]
MTDVLRFLLRIPTAVFAIIVVLVAYHVAKTPFEVMVVSGLAIIFASVNLMQISLLIEGDEREDRDVQRFIRILTALHDPGANNLTMNALKLRSSHAGQAILFLAYSVVDAVIIIIALVRLFYVVL